MNSLLTAVTLFCQKIGLPQPTEDKDIFTFTIEEQEINLTEFPEGHLLMFSELPEHYIKDPHQIEIYSDNLYKPSIGWSEEAHAWVVWNRQPLNFLDQSSIYEQVFHLSEGYVKASITTEKEPDPVLQMNNLFSTAIKA